VTFEYVVRAARLVAGARMGVIAGPRALCLLPQRISQPLLADSRLTARRVTILVNRRFGRLGQITVGRRDSPQIAGRAERRVPEPRRIGRRAAALKRDVSSRACPARLDLLAIG